MVVLVHFHQRILNTGIMSFVHQARKIKAFFVLVCIFSHHNSRTAELVFAWSVADESGIDCDHLRQVKHRQHGSCYRDSVVEVNAFIMADCKAFTGDLRFEFQPVIVFW
ncbi:hypothetical protein JGD89_24855 [Salmonella enterica subsp. enterica serovar Rissen]|nr:hypothetical protein [Salmonella enterica subsp. enterica serovar Rissen]